MSLMQLLLYLWFERVVTKERNTGERCHGRVSDGGKSHCFQRVLWGLIPLEVPAAFLATRGRPGKTR